VKPPAIAAQIRQLVQVRLHRRRVVDTGSMSGHESYRTTERSAYLAPDAHDKVVESWARRHDASVMHERKQGRPS
jgi:hypothetical protein